MSLRTRRAAGDEQAAAFSFRLPCLGLLCLVLLGLSPMTALGDDRAALDALLDEFLSRVDESAMHERFWDDALIYTSSSGARFGKADILAGMSASDSDALAEPAVSYQADDVQIELYGDTAVVAFRLVALTETGSNGGSERDEYFNTGTFARRPDGWRAVAWQATRIPEEN